MVSKYKTLDHLSALSGLKQKKMTPKIIDASSYVSLASNQTVPRKKQQQSAKQFYSVKWQNGQNNKTSYSPVGFINRSSDNQPQPLKRQSPKSHSAHVKIDNSFHYPVLFQQQQQPQSQIRQQTQRTSPSRVSPAANGAKGSPATTPVGHNSSSSIGTGPGAYAGAKFSEPPAPNALPKPPTHWMSTTAPEAKLLAGTIDSITANNPLLLGNLCCAEISDHIKILLNMQA